MLEMRRLQIAAPNREVNGVECADGFQFRYDTLANEKIQTVFANLMIFVEKRHRFPTYEINST